MRMMSRTDKDCRPMEPAFPDAAPHDLFDLEKCDALKVKQPMHIDMLLRSLVYVHKNKWAKVATERISDARLAGHFWLDCDNTGRYTSPGKVNHSPDLNKRPAPPYKRYSRFCVEPCCYRVRVGLLGVRRPLYRDLDSARRAHTASQGPSGDQQCPSQLRPTGCLHTSAIHSKNCRTALCEGIRGFRSFNPSAPEPQIPC